MMELFFLQIWDSIPLSEIQNLQKDTSKPFLIYLNETPSEDSSKKPDSKDSKTTVPLSCLRELLRNPHQGKDKEFADFIERMKKQFVTTPKGKAWQATIKESNSGDQSASSAEAAAPPTQVMIKSNLMRELGSFEPTAFLLDLISKKPEVLRVIPFVQLLQTFVSSGSFESCEKAIAQLAREHLNIPQQLTTTILSIFKSNVATGDHSAIINTIDTACHQIGFVHPSLLKLIASFGARNARFSHQIMYDDKKQRSTPGFASLCDTLNLHEDYLTAVLALCQETIDDEVPETMAVLAAKHKLSVPNTRTVMSLAKLLWSSVPFSLRQNLILELPEVCPSTIDSTVIVALQALLPAYQLMVKQQEPGQERKIKTQTTPIEYVCKVLAGCGPFIPSPYIRTFIDTPFVDLIQMIFEQSDSAQKPAKLKELCRGILDGDEKIVKRALASLETNPTIFSRLEMTSKTPASITEKLAKLNVQCVQHEVKANQDAISHYEYIKKIANGKGENITLTPMQSDDLKELITKKGLLQAKMDKIKTEHDLLKSDRNKDEVLPQHDNSYCIVSKMGPCIETNSSNTGLGTSDYHHLDQQHWLVKEEVNLNKDASGQNKFYVFENCKAGDATKYYLTQKESKEDGALMFLEAATTAKPSNGEFKMGCRFELKQKNEYVEFHSLSSHLVLTLSSTQL